MDFKKSYNRLCHRLLPPDQCKTIAEQDERDASRYAQIDKILGWFAEIRDRRSHKQAEKISATQEPEGQTSG